MFNIDKIVKECPRVIEDIKKYFNISLDGRNTVALEDDDIVFRNANRMYYIHYRELFDYFDSVEIEIEVHRAVFGGGWDFRIADLFGILLYTSHNKLNFFVNRTEAEYKAFERAFEIRQQQIEEKNETT